MKEVGDDYKARNLSHETYTYTATYYDYNWYGYDSTYDNTYSPDTYSDVDTTGLPY